MQELTNAEKAVELLKRGTSSKDIAEELGIPEATVRSYKAKELPLAEMKTELSELQNQFNTVATTLKTVQREKDSVATELQTVQQERDSVATKLQIVQREKESVATELETLQREKESVATTLQTVQQKDSTNSKALQTLQREKDSVATLLKSVQREKELMEADFKIQKGEIDSLQKQLNAASQSGDVRLNDNQRHLNDRIVDLKKLLEDAKKDYTAKIAQLEGEKTVAMDKIGDASGQKFIEIKNAVNEENKRLTTIHTVAIAEKDTVIKGLQATAVDMTEKGTAAIEAKDAEIEQLNAQIAEFKAQLEPNWWQKNITPFDVVNALSNCVAAWDIVNFMNFHPVSFIISAAFVLTFIGIVITIKKTESLLGSIVGMIGLVAAEFVYWYLLRVFMTDILKDRPNLGGLTDVMAAHWGATVFALASVFCAFMTLLVTIDKVIAKRKAAKVAAAKVAAAKPEETTPSVQRGTNLDSTCNIQLGTA